MTDLKSGSNSIDIDDIAVMSYTDWNNKQRTYNVTNSFDETQEVHEIKDNTASSEYAKEATIDVYIPIPANVSTGNYTANYTIGVYT